ncbi:MAG: hypothetical protein LBE80_09160 [Deltaproteobacteria bacterium]|jgi:hypothetical protein|nr:hypothetical protein [Deltaproteobacteria bacterium]
MADETQNEVATKSSETEKEVATQSAESPNKDGTKSAEGPSEEAAEPVLLPEGIYLETKKNIIGTGSTAKVAEYRNFWATLRVSELVMEMILLDDNFGLTGIKEKFPTEVVSGPNWLFVHQGEKRYAQIKQKLNSMLAAAAAKQAAKKPAASASNSKKGGWWTK